METHWIVEQITEKPGLVEARLQRVEWFKKNPAFAAAMADENEPDLPEEFIDAEPGEEGAETIEVGGALTMDVTEGPEMHPLDAVLISLRVVTPVEV